MHVTKTKTRESEMVFVIHIESTDWTDFGCSESSFAGFSVVIGNGDGNGDGEFSCSTSIEFDFGFIIIFGGGSADDVLVSWVLICASDVPL